MHTERVEPRGAAARKSNHRIRYDRLILIVVSVFGASLALADPEPKKTLFDIEAQPASTALTLYARQARVQLGFSADVVNDVLTNAVKGEYESAQALELLLEGTGLEAEHGAKGIIIRRAAAQKLTNAMEEAPAIPLAGDLQLTQTAVQGRSQSRASSVDDSQDDDHEAVRKREEIVVTGSRIRGAKSVSPVVTITREEIDRAGFATVEEFVDNLPQNFGAGASLDTRTDVANSQNVVGGVTDNLAGGTSVNLRGLGASSTLILLNGRRMSPSGRSARFTNISSIPVTAIERVEVLTDGASAIYGSDAIGGVINFILRDDYEGAETRLRYGSDGRGDTSNLLVGQSFGTSWEKGSILLTYEYYDSDNLANSDRELTATTDLSRFGGTDRRTPGGHPANINAGGQLWAIPPGQDGTSLTVADFDSTVPPNLYNERAAADVMPALERHSGFLKVMQEIGPFETFAEAQFSSQESDTRFNVGNIDFEVTDANPYFIDPTGSGLTAVRVDNYSFEEEFAGVGFGDIDSFGGAVGAQFGIGENWDVEFVSYWFKEKAEQGIEVGLNRPALNAALLQTDRSLAFNPFGDGSVNSVSIIESIIDRSRDVSSESENELRALSLNIDGPLFDLRGGPVQLASGVEFREESLLTISDFAGGGASALSRNVLAVYSEFYLPLVGSSNDRPGLRQLDVSLAARYEHYGDFGDTLNPKVGIVWSPTQSVRVRGTYGTSFRAPALFDLDVTNLTDNAAIYLPEFLADLGFIPFPMIVRVGGNEDLQPEEAATWTAGIEWSPANIDGLLLDVTYFNIDFHDRIDLPIGDASFADDPRFRTLVINMPTQEQIAALVNDPRWDESIFGVPAADVLSGIAPVDAIFDVRKNNLSKSVVTGVDLQLGYMFETKLGLFDVGLNASYLFDFERAFIPGDPLIDEVDEYGRPVDLRLRGHVTWRGEGWSATGFVNYIDGYTDSISDPARPVDSWTTFDVSLAYDTGDNRGAFSDMRLSLIVQNAFDEDPPFVDTTGGLGYDSANADPLGRVLALQIAKNW